MHLSVGRVNVGARSVRDGVRRRPIGGGFCRYGSRKVGLSVRVGWTVVFAYLLPRKSKDAR